MKKSTVRLIIFASIIAAIFIAAFVCFAISKGIKVTFDENTVALQGAIAAGDDALAAELQAKNDVLSGSYRIVSFASYFLTIAGLAAFGISLAINDHIRDKEDAAARG